MASEVFVGRVQELARLRSALDDTRSGSSRLVVISGEAGIGKTVLARSLINTADTAYMTVGVGRAWEGAGAPAFYPWSCAFEAARRPLEATHVRPTDSDTFPAIERVIQHVRRLCQQRPTVLLLDDLQWADVPALRALQVLARNPPERLLLLGTLRIPELVPPAITELLDKILREVEVIALGGLPSRDLDALPEAKDLSSDLVHAVHRVTRGNPFFARELLRDRAAHAALAERGDVILPDSARAVLAQRLASLPASPEILACAAIGPQPRLDASLVARALNCRQEVVQSAFDVALQAGVLARTTDALLAFAHDLVRAAAIEQLTPAQRVELHGAWARALEGSIDPNLVIRGAVHAVSADPLSVDEELRDRAFHAAEVALAQTSLDDAAALFEFAASSDDRAGRVGGAVRAFAALAEALTHAGDPDRGAQVAERALEIARKAKDADALARAALAASHKRRLGSPDSSIIQTLDDALHGLYALAPAACDISLLCAVEARLAAALQPFVDPPRALGLARSAISRARATNDEKLLARILHAARPAFRILDDLHERLELDSELLHVATKHGNVILAAQARERLCMTALERGDAVAFETNLQAFGELAEDTRLAQHELGMLSLRTARSIMLGDLDRAQSLIAQVEAARPRWSMLSPVVPSVDPVTLLGTMLAFVTGEQAGYRALADAPTAPLTRSVFTLLCEIRCGRRREAEQLYGQIADRVLDPRAQNFVFHTILANAAIALGDTARAAPLLAFFAPFAGRHVVWAPFTVYDGSIDRLRGGLTLLLGDRDAAAEHHARAIADEEAFGADAFANRTRAERDAMGSIAVDAAPRTSEERVRAAAEGWGLTRRTSEVLALLVDGHANATIAELLGISTRAVELHITKLLDRAGVDGRAALIARVLGR